MFRFTAKFDKGLKLGTASKIRKKTNPKDTGRELRVHKTFTRKQ